MNNAPNQPAVAPVTWSLIADGKQAQISCAHRSAFCNSNRADQQQLLPLDEGRSTAPHETPLVL